MAVAGRVAELIWRGEEIADFSTISSGRKSDSDWRMANFLSGKPDAEFMTAVRLVAGMLDRRSYVHHFWPGLEHAINTAMETMRDSGATEEKANAWHAAFVEAFEPYVISTAQELDVDDLSMKSRK